MITGWGAILAIIFLISYLGQSVSSGMRGLKSKLVQWSCWIIASASMLICYLLKGQ
jgi:hypothetical protein